MPNKIDLYGKPEKFIMKPGIDNWGEGTFNPELRHHAFTLKSPNFIVEHVTVTRTHVKGCEVVGKPKVKSNVIDAFPVSIFEN